MKLKQTTVSLTPLHHKVLREYTSQVGVTVSGWVKKQIEQLPNYEAQQKKALAELEAKFEAKTELKAAQDIAVED